MMTWEINCDLGEGCGNDHVLIPLIDSANIACGGHAGDEQTMERTVQLCLQHHVRVGAHPSFPDRENFGRKEMYLPEEQVAESIESQIRLLQSVARKQQSELHHVKLHGALYNVAARSPELARVMAKAIYAVSKDLVVYAPGGSEMEKAAKRQGLATRAEAFADRRYAADGSLLARLLPGSLLSIEEAVVQVENLITSGEVTAADGSKIPVRAETVCIHGDGPQAVALARALRTLKQEDKFSKNQSQ